MDLKEKFRLKMETTQSIINQEEIHSSWWPIFEKELNLDYFQRLKSFIDGEISRGTPIFPPKHLIFRAFNLTPLNKVKVVILGQDPYHNDGQAHGLSFSVPTGIKLPPSLRNIFKEMIEDVEGFEVPFSGDLTKWAKEGVLLLNTILTVEAHQAASHQNKGWEQFTDAIIGNISKKNENVVFILWGKYAQVKKNLIDPEKHYIIQSAHPSPLSARHGFFGSKPFSATNNYLRAKDQKEIDWHL